MHLHLWRLVSTLSESFCSETRRYSYPLGVLKSMIKKIIGVAGVLALISGCTAEETKDDLGRIEETSCTVKENRDGTSTIDCPDGSSVTVGAGPDGKDGKNGAKGPSGKKGDPGQDGLDGEKGDPGQDGLDGEKGDPGASCSVACVNDNAVRIVCENGTEQSYSVESCGSTGAPPLTAGMLSTNDNHGCQVLPADGRLVCWGQGGFSQLGRGIDVTDQQNGSFVATQAMPRALETTWKSVSAGTGHTCAITSEAEGYCWGSNKTPAKNGVLGVGLGSLAFEAFPKPIDRSGLPSNTGWALVSAGSSSTCGITTDGIGYCWGEDGAGQLGNGALSGVKWSPSRIDRSALAPGVTWSTLSVGVDHACGVTTDGGALCWGSDAQGQLGNGPTLTGIQESPTRVDLADLPPETKWAAVSAGGQYTCGVTTTGQGYCWGSDSGGVLGNGALGNTDRPGLVDAAALRPGTVWKQMSAGFQTSCGVATDGAAYCWGRALGNGASTSTTSQVAVAVDTTSLPEGTSWIAVDAGRQYACGLTTAGTTYCWGADSLGKLGNGTAGSLTKPEIAVKATIGVLPSAMALAGALSDPTNPGIGFTVIPSTTSAEDVTLTISSSNDEVIPVANITISGTGIERIASFAPVGVGYATITFTAQDPLGNQTAIALDYAASGVAPDPSGRYHHGISDASTAIDVGGGYMLLGNDETNEIFLHRQDQSGPALKVWNLDDVLGGSELDIEGAARMGDTIVWVTSHGNARDGDVKEWRRILFATKVTGTGADVELEFSGRYGGGEGPKQAAGLRGMWSDIIAWDRTDGHGLGADFLGFFAATREGVIPNAPGGFNIEGFEFAADGTTGYLGFRAPTIDMGGTQHALIVPVTNILELVDGVSSVQTGRAQFGAPILLDLAGRSIRELRRNNTFEYIILAGPPDNATPSVNDTFALYVWDGDPSHVPVLNQELPQPNYLTGGAWEGILSAPSPTSSGTPVRLIADSGDTIYNGGTSTFDQFVKSYSQVFTLQ